MWRMAAAKGLLPRGPRAASPVQRAVKLWPSWKLQPVQPHSLLRACQNLKRRTHQMPRAAFNAPTYSSSRLRK